MDQSPKVDTSTTGGLGSKPMVSVPGQLNSSTGNIFGVINPPGTPPNRRVGGCFDRRQQAETPDTSFTQRTLSEPGIPQISADDTSPYDQKIAAIEQQFASKHHQITVSISSMPDLYALQNVLARKNPKEITLQITDSVEVILKYLDSNKKFFSSIGCIEINSYNLPDPLDIPNIVAKQLVIVASGTCNMTMDEASTLEAIIIAQCTNLTEKTLSEIFIGKLRNLKFFSVSSDSSLFLDLSKYSSNLQTIKIEAPKGTIEINETQKKVFENGTWELVASKIVVRGPTRSIVFESTEEGGIRLKRTPTSSPTPERARDVNRPRQQLDAINEEERQNRFSNSVGTSTDSLGSDSSSSISRSPRPSMPEPVVSPEQIKAREDLLSTIQIGGLASIDRRALDTEELAALNFLIQEGWVQKDNSGQTAKGTLVYPQEGDTESLLNVLLEHIDDQPGHKTLVFNNPKNLSFNYSRGNGMQILAGKDSALTAYLNISKAWVPAAEKLIVALFLLLTLHAVYAKSVS